MSKQIHVGGVAVGGGEYERSYSITISGVGIRAVVQQAAHVLGIAFFGSVAQHAVGIAINGDVARRSKGCGGQQGSGKQEGGKGGREAAFHGQLA